MKVVFNEIARDEFEDAIEFYELEYPGNQIIGLTILFEDL